MKCVEDETINVSIVSYSSPEGNRLETGSTELPATYELRLIEMNCSRAVFKFVRDFEILRKWNISFIMSVCLSVCLPL